MAARGKNNDRWKAVTGGGRDEREQLREGAATGGSDGRRIPVAAVACCLPTLPPLAACPRCHLDRPPLRCCEGQAQRQGKNSFLLFIYEFDA